jgi:predicted dienelactone hydrolase
LSIVSVEFGVNIAGAGQLHDLPGALGAEAMRCRHFLNDVILCVIAGGLALAPSQARGQQTKAPPDTPNVETVESIVLKDKNRQKDLPVAACFPRERGPFPVIVFSHGSGGSHHYLLPLAQDWAMHGYVCLLPTHGDSLLLRRGAEDFDRPRPRRRAAAALDDWKNWQERPRDVSYLLDALAELEVQARGLKGKMDRARIGVAGHSLGAYTAQLIGGATIDLPDGRKGQSFADPRVRAVLLLSGQGVGQQGLTESSWANLKVPMLSVTGSLDPGARGQPPEWRKDPFKYSPAGDKYQVFIEGATHGSFVGRSEEGGDARAVFDCVKIATLAFWNAYLKGDQSAKKILQSDRIVATDKPIMTLDRK